MGIEPTVPLPGQQFSRLPDSATLAPLHMVELISRQGRVGADDRRYDRLWRQLTLGSVIFQSVFLSLEDPSPVYLVSLVGLVYLVCLVQPNTRDRPNRPDRPFFQHPAKELSE